MFSLVGKQQQNLCTKTTMENLWYTLATSFSLRKACQNYSSLLRLVLLWLSTPTATTSILYFCPLPQNVTPNSSQEKPAKLLPLLANAASLPPSKPPSLPPLPLANAARPPLKKPQPLLNDAVSEADAIKQTKYIRDY
jgi:hypothetical protein